MNDNYLWNKTGSDAEIEELENALSAFRLQKQTAPQIPAKIVAFPKQFAPRRRMPFQFALAAAACLTIAVAAFGVWIQISTHKTVVTTNPGQTEVLPKEVTAQPSPVQDETVFAAVRNPEIQKQTPVRGAVKTNKSVQSVAVRKEIKARAVKTQKPAVELTEEEQRAYDQLMLALSITSSKLKAVKDAVQGGDE